MQDLYIGLACIFVLATLLFISGVVVARRASYPVSVIVMALLMAALFCFLQTDGDRLWLARLLPVANLIVVGNITLPTIALVCGMAVARMPGRLARRCVLVVPLIAMAAYYTVRPMLGTPPPMGDFWQKNVCRQTSGASCSAAAAATLLLALKIPATESEMATLCLTRPDGTPMQGVYRGLILKTSGSPLYPRPFHCDIDTLCNTLDGPVLLTVGLNPGGNADPRYEKKWGWAPGVRHTIVLFRFLPNERVEVGDPGAGREVWSIESLKVLWHGNGIRMIHHP